MNRKEISLNDLPISLLSKTFSFLAPEKIHSLRLINKKFNRAAHYEWLWKQKFMQHFPHLKANGDYFDEFKKAYKREYASLTNYQRKVISIVKEGDLEALKKLRMKLYDLLDTRDYREYDLTYLGRHNQNILNHFYAIATHYYSKKNQDFNYYQETYVKIDPKKRTYLAVVSCIMQFLVINQPK